MILRAVLILQLSFFASLALGQEATDADTSITIAWASGFDDAQAIAVAEGRTILLDFFTEW